MFNCKLTALEVIDKELTRLHKELSSYSGLALEDDNKKDCYLAVASKLDKLHSQLIELAKDERLIGED